MQLAKPNPFFHPVVTLVIPVFLFLMGCAADREPPPFSVTGQPIKFPEKLNGVAAGTGAVWVKGTNHLYRIDPQRKVITATIPLGRSHDAYMELAVTEDAVWAVNSLDNSISRVDPSTNEVVATIPVGGIPGSWGRIHTFSRPSRLWVGEGSVWVLNYREGTLTRIDPSRNEVIATVSVGVRPPYPRSVLFAGAVWVANPAQSVTRGLTTQFVEGKSLQIDPGTNQVLATIALVQPTPTIPYGGAYVALGEGAAWALYRDEGHDCVLSRIDLRTQKETTRVPLGPGSIAMTIGGGDLGLATRFCWGIHREYNWEALSN